MQKSPKRPPKTCGPNMIKLLITDLREIKKKMLFNFICEQMCGIQGSSASF